ncbi:MAG: fructose-6-phosphate aldolase [Acidobacteria bacterium]|nr:MAG: fructose-6-phosphate aldolase [Acidobacteriota bacterium]
MKLFLDTANLDEIRQAADLGLIDGVTTNPSLVAKQGLSRDEVIAEICSIVDGPISAEVISTDFEGMMKEAQEVAKLHDNIVVKVPLTEAGLKTVSKLTPEGIDFNVTLCFSVAQALLAAKAGARFVSPFVGRWDDIDQPGIELIPDMIAIYENYGYETEILVASVRSPLHVTEAAVAGADIATLPFKVLKQMIAHPLTDIGLEKFLKDYRAAQQ